MTQLFVDERDQSTVPGAFEEFTEREVPWGTITYEFAPAGWTAKNGQRRVQDWRAYWITPHGEKRRRAPSVTTFLGAVLPKDLTRYGEMHGAIGAHLLHQRGELTTENTDEEVVERVRLFKVGADAARDRAATRGIDVHAFLEEYGRTSRMPQMDVPLELAGYVQGLQNFIRDFDPEPLEVEALVADPDEGFAGRMDMKAVVRSEHLPIRETRVVDLKTNVRLSIWPGAHGQVRAYSRADAKCDGAQTSTPLIVVVDAEGRYAVQDCVCSDEQLDAALRWYRAVGPLNSHCEARHRQLRKAA